MNISVSALLFYYFLGLNNIYSGKVHDIHKYNVNFLVDVLYKCLKERYIAIDFCAGFTV